MFLSGMSQYWKRLFFKILTDFKMKMNKKKQKVNHGHFFIVESQLYVSQL